MSRQVRINAIKLKNFVKHIAVNLDKQLVMFQKTGAGAFALDNKIRGSRYR